MNIELWLNRSKAADFVIAILALIPAAVIYYGSFSPDAAIYFTFFKNFFGQPFSFAPETVSFGATSPLHVLVFAPVHALLGDYWLAAAGILNLVFVAFGVVLLNRALKGGTKTVLLFVLLVATSTALLVATAQLFEAGLAFFFMAWLYHDLEARRYERSVLIAGTLYLVRPELLLVGLAVIAYVIVQTKAEKRYMMFAAASFVLPLVYHLYMLTAAGMLVPASLFWPIITYINDPVSWLGRLGMTLSAFWSASGLIYLAGTVVFLFLLADWALPRYRRELLLCVPLLVLYFIFPPKGEILRYLIPTLPPVLAMIVRYLQQELKAQFTVRALAVSLVMAHGFGVAATARTPHVSESDVLLADLSGQLGPIAAPGDPVLLSQVQGQYYLKSPCISLTAAVGDGMLDVLLRRTTLKEFLADHQVKFVVLSNQAEERAPLERKMLADFYRFDPETSPGDTVEIDGMYFRKELSRSKWIEGEGTGFRPAALSSETGAMPATDQNPGPMWTSVYAVLGKAPLVPDHGLTASNDYSATVVDSGWTEVPAAPAGSTLVIDPVDSVASLIDTLPHQG